MAGVISGTTIASLIAMAAGAGLQYKAANDASKRATQETLRGLASQRDLQQQAEKKAMDQAQEFNTDGRKLEQDDITAALEQEFIAPVESAQAINSSVATTQGDVSADYSRAKTTSDLTIAKNARNLAGMMAKITGANRLRQNESVRMADTAAGLDRLNNFSTGQARADEIAIREGGRTDAGLELAGGLLQGAGMMGMSGAFSGAGNVAQPTADTMMSNAKLGSGMYLEAPIPTGMGAMPGMAKNTTLGTGMWGSMPKSFTWLLRIA